MRLQDNLVLFQYITDLLGGDYETVVAALQAADPGRRSDGQSHFYSSYEQRASRLGLVPGDPDAALRLLQGYDLNVLEHEDALRRYRPGFRLKYFQYLAALYTEIYLHRLTDDRGALLLALNSYRQTYFPDLPPYLPSDLYKLAFWMATGAGKTLLLHINLRQFLHYRPFDVQNILLLTPSPTLATQHLNELRLSGFTDAQHALDVRPGRQGVQVLEITKLYVDSADTDGTRGGASLPTSIFQGPNLLLVDEGHKGTATKVDQEAERAWRDIRNALVADGGFTFEYSATFAQVTENDDALCKEYSRAILYEYAYARFHRDGYGKDFDVINLRQDESFFGDTLLLGGLLTFYEQHRRYVEPAAEASDDIAPYQITPPLMVFVGAYVTGGADVLQVIQFLDRVLRDRAWATAETANLLAGKSGLPGEDNRDAFANAFPYLKHLGLAAEAVYDDLCARLFRGHGRLQLHLLRRAEGEIGFRTADSAHDAYCGVVNVGDAAGFLRKVEDETDITVGIEDHVSDSLFEAIEAPDSPLAFLVGSKKFIEGWSSWRVSVMGLLRVGRGAGAQVLQLFGRGIRLKGRDLGLRRSEALPGPHPSFLPLLETLHIFGLKANYLQTFLTTLDREGVAPPVMCVLPLTVMPDLRALGLQAVELRSQYDFKKESVVSFDPKGLQIVEDLTPKVVIGAAGQAQIVGLSLRPQALTGEILSGLAYEDLFYHALAHKATRGWHNLYVTRAAIHRFFAESSQLIAPEELLKPTRPEHWAVLDRAAKTLLERGLQAFYYREQRRAETKQLAATPVDENHPNFPRATLWENGQEATKLAYELRVPRELLAEVQAIIRSETRRVQTALDEPVPRLHLDFHLYWPLLLKDRARLNLRNVQFLNSIPRITSSPVGLELSEAQFAVDLREHWAQVQGTPTWDGCHIYLLRNLSRKGIGFFQTAGFYPDFLLWLTRGTTQALAFIDPKGLSRTSWQKIELLQYIRALTPQIGFPLLSYIVSLTPFSQIQVPANTIPSGQDIVAWLQQRQVLQQQGNYVGLILDEMLKEIVS